MTASPIYDQLRAEMGADAPFCSACGSAVVLHSVDRVCSDCWMKGQHETNWPEAWKAHHCHDCQEFLLASYVIDRPIPTITEHGHLRFDREWIIVCAEHFAKRAGKHTVWDTRSIGNIRVVDRLPVPADVFPSIERIAA